MTHSFIEKSYIKRGGKTIPRPFAKKSKLSMTLDQWSKFFTVCLYCMLSWRLSNFIETKLQALVFTPKKVFLKTKRSLELASLPHFLHCFWRKIIILLCSINRPNSIFWLPLLLENWAIRVFNCLLTRWWRHELWN